MRTGSMTGMLDAKWGDGCCTTSGSEVQMHHSPTRIHHLTR
jgi:hypothetical protein